MFGGSAKTVAKSITDKKIIYEVTVLANISFLKELGTMHYCCCKGKKKTIQQISKNQCAISSRCLKHGHHGF